MLFGSTDLNKCHIIMIVSLTMKIVIYKYSFPVAVLQNVSNMILFLPFCASLVSRQQLQQGGAKNTL